MPLQLSLGLNGERKFPCFKATMSALGPIPAFLYQAMEFGTAQNRAYFKELCDGERPRPHIREHVVRDNAKRFLGRTPLSVEDEEVVLGSEPLAALVVRVGNVQIRILKGPNGTIPGCAGSPKRRDFYNQKESLYRDSKGTIRAAKLNLVALWEFDKNFNLAPMSLALPTSAGDRSADVLCSWNEIIPHPATRLVALPCPDIARVEQELERLLSDNDEPEDQKKAEA